MPKYTYVEMESIKGERRKFIFEHAFRLLKNPSIKSWTLPEDSKWQYEKGNLTRRKSDQGPANEQTT